jgi:hypothetical protein
LEAGASLYFRRIRERMSVFDWETSREGVGRHACVASHRSVIIPIVTSLGIPAVFWLRLYGFKEWATAPKGVGR